MPECARPGRGPARERRQEDPGSEDPSQLPRLPPRRSGRGRAGRGHRVQDPRRDPDRVRPRRPARLLHGLRAAGRRHRRHPDDPLHRRGPPARRAPPAPHPGAQVGEVAWHAYLRWLETQGDVVQRRGIPDEDGWLLRMRDLHAVRGPGDTCLSALRKGRMGTPEMPINESKGCGGVMRIAPAGFAPGQPFRIGCELAAITHGHPTGWLSAGYLAQLVHDVADGASLDEGAVRALDVLRRHPGHEETAAAVEKALWLSRAPRGTAADVESLGEGWVAEEALAIGLYAALAAESFEHGVLLAVNHSGDSDSTGAIAGSLLGVALGELAIPRRWLDTARAARRHRAGGRRPAPPLRHRKPPLRRRPVRVLGPLPALLTARPHPKGRSRARRRGRMFPGHSHAPGGTMNRKLFLSLAALGLALSPVAIARRRRRQAAHRPEVHREGRGLRRPRRAGHRHGHRRGRPQPPRHAEGQEGDRHHQDRTRGRRTSTRSRSATSSRSPSARASSSPCRPPARSPSSPPSPPLARPPPSARSRPATSRWHSRARSPSPRST